MSTSKTQTPSGSSSHLGESLAAQRIVSQSLRRSFSYVQEKTGSLWICCPHPEHGKRDRTPSLKFNLDQNAPVPIGFSYCFGCGQKMPWNAFAEKFKLPERLKDTDLERTEVSNVRNKIRRIYAKSDAQAPTLEGIALDSWGVSALHDVHDDWRDISARLLQRIGAKLGVSRSAETSQNLAETSLFLPVNVNQSTVGVVKARMLAIKGAPSYYNSVGEWSKTSGLFPFDYTIDRMTKWGTRTLVISEGPRDALNGLAHKIPVVSILGVKLWTERKRNLILSRDVEKVILAFDGDSPGIKATKALYEAFDGYVDVDYLATRKYNTKKEAADLGAAPQDMIDELLDMCYHTKE